MPNIIKATLLSRVCLQHLLFSLFYGKTIDRTTTCWKVLQNLHKLYSEEWNWKKENTADNYFLVLLFSKKKEKTEKIHKKRKVIKKKNFHQISTSVLTGTTAPPLRQHYHCIALLLTIAINHHLWIASASKKRAVSHVSLAMRQVKTLTDSLTHTVHKIYEQQQNQQQ